MVNNNRSYVCLLCGKRYSTEEYFYIKLKSYLSLFSFSKIKCSNCCGKCSIKEIDTLLCDVILNLYSKGYYVLKSNSLIEHNSTSYIYLEFKKPLSMKSKPVFMNFPSEWSACGNSIFLNKINNFIIYHKYSKNESISTQILEIKKKLLEWSMKLPSYYEK